VSKNGLSLHTIMALACGGLMPFAFSPFDYAWLAIPARFRVTLGCPCRCAPFRIGYAFGFGWFGFGAWW